MASRMDRYNNSLGRSEKNKALYEEINELDTYTNIEGVTEMSNSNEISMDTIRELIKSNEQKVAKLNKIKVEEKTEPVDDTPTKNYDIKDILNKAKIDHTNDDARYRKLNNMQYDVLKDIKVEDIDDVDELKAIIDTLSLGSQNSDDLGLLDELKSNTMVGDASSIKTIIQEEKSAEAKEREINTQKEFTSHLTNVDTSFFTSSFSFSDKDFEDLKNIEDETQNKSKFVNILIVVFSILIAIALLFIVMKFVF